MQRAIDQWMAGLVFRNSYSYANGLWFDSRPWLILCSEHDYLFALRLDLIYQKQLHIKYIDLIQ